MAAEMVCGAGDSGFGPEAVEAFEPGEYSGGLEWGVKLDAIVPDDFGRLAVAADFPFGARDCFEKVAEPFFLYTFDIEVSIVVEQSGEVTAHAGDQSADDFLDRDLGFGDSVLNMLLDFGTAQDLISGLIGAGGAIAGGDGGLFAIPIVFDVFIDEPLFTIG